MTELPELPVSYEDSARFVSAEEIASLRSLFPEVRVSDDVAGYIMDIVAETRGEAFSMGVSTRGAIAPLIELGAGFDLDLTARENIFLNGSVLGFSKKFMEEHFDEIVDFSEMQEFLDTPMKNYSSGMIARIPLRLRP